MTYRSEIHAQAVTLLLAAPSGLRFGELRAKVRKALPHIPPATVSSNVGNLESLFPNEIVKPARGLFLHASYHKANAAPPPGISSLATASAGKVKEEDFYEPFADWLVNGLEECSRAIAVGGNRFKDKWGTPDVVGVREPKKSDIIQFPIEIVSAEIKLDSYGLIVAFGQACSYKLFSHKTHIVVPSTSTEDDLARLDALCMIFGIGLVLFDVSKPNDPQFDIRVRATRHEPDMFYVNQNMKLIEKELFG